MERGELSVNIDFAARSNIDVAIGDRGDVESHADRGAIAGRVLLGIVELAGDIRGVDGVEHGGTWRAIP